jgi:hypothetical protein
VRAAVAAPAPLLACAPAPSVRSKAQDRLQLAKTTTKQAAKKDVGSFLIKLFNKFLYWEPCHFIV